MVAFFLAKQGFGSVTEPEGNVQMDDEPVIRLKRGRKLVSYWLLKRLK
jgi:hypothetical protein